VKAAGETPLAVDMQPPTPCGVKRLLDLTGMTIGGWLGWAAGAPAGIFTAFIVSIVGTGLGLYLVRRFARNLP
jgi:hypothetical protein